MEVGICIKPSTPAAAVVSLLNKYKQDSDSDTSKDLVNVHSSLIDSVNLLAVEPGVGGQPFQSIVLNKVKQIRQAHSYMRYLAVDGGINAQTAELAVAAGANVLVVGSFLFGDSGGYFTGEEARKRYLFSVSVLISASYLTHCLHSIENNCLLIFVHLK